MSGEGIEVVLRANAAFNRGDLDGFVTCLDPEVVIEDLNHAPDVESVVAKEEGARRLVARWADMFAQLGAELESVVAVAGHVFCSVRWHGAGRESGAAVDLRAVDVHEVRDGRIVRMTLGHRDQRAALESVGLVESAEPIANVERVLGWFGDLDSGGLTTEHLGPGFEVQDFDLPDAGVYKGEEGYLRWLEQWGAPWEEYGGVVELAIGLEDKVVIIFKLWATGKGSGIRVERRDGMVWSLAGGKAVRLEYYGSAEEALVAADPALGTAAV